MFLFRKNKVILEKIDSYLNLALKLSQSFQQSMTEYFENGLSDKFTALLTQTADIESLCDTSLHEIEIALYEKSLLPESREDILVLLEKIDDIADQAEYILNFIDSHRVILPEYTITDIEKLVLISTKSYNLVVETAKDLFGKRVKIPQTTKLISGYEKECDNICLSVVKKIFSSEIMPFDKIITRDTIYAIEDISNYCDDAADIITILNVKRVV